MNTNNFMLKFENVFERLRNLEQVKKPKTLTIQKTSEVEILPVVKEGCDCPVCMEPITDSGFVTLDCKHQLCLGCFLEMRNRYEDSNNRCPLCRQEFQPVIEFTPEPTPEPVRFHPNQTQITLANLLTNVPNSVTNIRQLLIDSVGGRTLAESTIRNNLNTLFRNGLILKTAGLYSCISQPLEYSPEPELNEEEMLDFLNNGE